VKYYTYISDTKVDMLYAQIPKGIRSKIAAGLKIDLQLLELSFSEKPTQETRYSKLDVVTDYIRRNLDMGSVDQPEAYFQERLPMSWGFYGFPREKQIVYFGGETEKTILGLAGSINHMIGRVPDKAPPTTDQTVPFILEVLEKVERSNSKVSTISSSRQEASWLRAVELATSQIFRQGPKQQLEFLAKRFIGGPLRDKQVLLGSPLYVAIAD